MAKRPRDVVSVETVAGGCDLYSSVELVHDMHAPATLSLSVGDDGAWRTISRIFAPGREARLFLNGNLQFTGRFETNTVPTSTNGGAVARIVARTKLMDARYTTADVKTRVNNVSIKDFLLALFAPLGFTLKDFVFDAATDRNLMTGIRVGASKPVDLEPLLESKAKVQLGEEIYAAASRHLKRHHLTLWDGADGRIVIGAPDDEQPPRYSLRAKRGEASRANNISSPTRIVDWSECASEVHVYGDTVSEDDDPRPFRGIAGDVDLLAIAADTGHFARKLQIKVDGLHTQAKAEAQARRELASRAKQKDAWEHGVDDWTFWDGQRAIPWTINATVDVDVDSIGSDGAGRYLIHRVVRTLDKDGAASGELTLAAPGVLVI